MRGYLVHTSGAMKGTIKYCLKDNKVRDEITGRRMVSGINCNGENAYLEFMTTKLAYGKADEFSHISMCNHSPPKKISHLKRLMKWQENLQKKPGQIMKFSSLPTRIHRTYILILL